MIDRAERNCIAFEVREDVATVNVKRNLVGKVEHVTQADVCGAVETVSIVLGRVFGVLPGEFRRGGTETERTVNVEGKVEAIARSQTDAIVVMATFGRRAMGTAFGVAEAGFDIARDHPLGRDARDKPRDEGHAVDINARAGVVARFATANRTEHSGLID